MANAAVLLGLLAMIIAAAGAVYIKRRAPVNGKETGLEVLAIISAAHVAYGGSVGERTPPLTANYLYPPISAEALVKSGKFTSRYIRNGTILDPYGQPITLAPGDNPKAFSITLTDLPKTGCYVLMTRDWNFDNTDQVVQSVNLNGGDDLMQPLSPTEAQSQCTGGPTNTVKILTY